MMNTVVLEASGRLADRLVTEDGWLGALGQGLGVTVAGLVIVFAALLIIAALISVFARLAEGKQKPLPEIEPAAVPEPAAPVTQVEEPVDEEELVAVLTAAVAACMDRPADGLVVRSYRRVGGNGRSWTGR